LLRVISREAGAFRAAEPPDVHPGLRGDLEDELGKVLVLHGFGEAFVDVGGGDLDGSFFQVGGVEADLFEDSLQDRVEAAAVSEDPQPGPLPQAAEAILRIRGVGACGRGGKESRRGGC